MGVLLKKYVWVLHLLLIFIASFFAAKIAASIVAAKLQLERTFSLTKTGVSEEARKTLPPRETYQVMIDRNMFDSREIVAPIPEATAPPEELNLDGPAVKTTLSVKLLSTFSVAEGTDQRSTASIAGGSGSGGVDVYTVGDEKSFAKGVKITKILPDRVEFINGSRLEYVELEKLGGGGPAEKGNSAVAGNATAGAGGIQQVESGKFVIERAEIDKALSDPNQLFSQIRMRPVSGKLGFRVDSLRPGSVFEKLGIKRNDVLERVNGQELSDVKKSIEIFGQLKDSNRITIDLVRDNNKTTLDYEIQ